ncbi:1-acyl-sn-glycerol-3-phosphate acyltransferase, partial [bacterium]|nr:1-acyl-sn-glycerol-3-phosphate acyltransferase [bacterium]
MEIIGIENFQEKGGIVLASNHMSYLDPIILGSAAPRPIHFLAKDSLFKGSFLKSFFLSCNAFPVNRD